MQIDPYCRRWRGGATVGRRTSGRKAMGSIPGRGASCSHPLALEGSPVSSLKCDRWQRSKFRELLGCCLRRQWKLILQAGWLCRGTRAVAISQVAGLLPGSPTGAQRACRGTGRPAGQPLGLAEEKQKLVYLKLGAILNTVQGSLYLHITHTYRHTHTHSRLCNGPTYVALALWLNGPPCKWSGVEWETPGALPMLPSQRERR